MAWGVSLKQNNLIRDMVNKAWLDFRAGGAGLLAPAPFITLAEWIPEFESLHIPGVKPKSQKIYRELLKFIKRSSITPKRLDEINKADFKTLIEESPTMISGRSKNALMIMLRNLLVTAKEYRKLHLDIESLDFYPTNRTIRDYTIEEEVAYFSAIEDDHFRCLVTLLRTTGMRPGEIVAMRWERNFDWVHGTIIVHEGKTDHVRRTVDLSRDMIDTLAAIGIDREGWVVPARSEKNKIGHMADAWYSELHKSTMKKAGFQSVNEDGRRLVLYGWKHTFATDCVQNGIDLGVLQQMLGHTHIATTMQYVNVRSQAVLDGYKKIQQRVHENVQRKRFRIIKKTGTTAKSKI